MNRRTLFKLTGLLPAIAIAPQVTSATAESVPVEAKGATIKWELPPDNPILVTGEHPLAVYIDAVYVDGVEVDCFELNPRTGWAKLAKRDTSGRFVIATDPLTGETKVDTYEVNNATYTIRPSLMTLAMSLLRSAQAKPTVVLNT